MSTVKNQTELSGMLGEIISVRKVGGRVVVTNRPKRRVKNPFGRQAVSQQKFLEASQYAKAQVAADDSRILYAGGITSRKRTAYLVAMSDHLTAPKVTGVDALGYDGTVGSTIEVIAVDDFKVTKVRVVLTKADGSIIEQGEATPDPIRTNLWQYTASVANPALPGTGIKAVAYDRPGNSGSAQVVL